MLDQMNAPPAACLTIAPAALVHAWPCMHPPDVLVNQRI
jgi:hypothetical protein